MTTESTRQLIRRYTDLLNEAVDSYYHRNVSLMSDDAFNQLYDTLAQLEQQHPDLICPDSPITNVGSDLDMDSKDQVPYQVPMLSIATKTDSTFKPAEDFVTRIQKAFHNVQVDFIAEPKYDGLAINARYLDSRLVSLSTRGNKMIGENVTHNVGLVQRLPLQLPEHVPGKLDVRGEVVIPTALMGRVNETVFQAWQQNYATPRHMAAALIRSRSGIPETLMKPLVFMAYGLGDSEHFHPASQSELLELLVRWGFYYEASYVVMGRSAQELYSHHQHLIHNRDKLGYEIDGVVYKVNNFELQRQLGVSGKEPRWAIAHKFPAAAKQSMVLDIQYQVGKNGGITPVVYIEPVEINGITVNKLNGHNLFKLREKRIRVGAPVMVELAGDVIPAISMSLPISTHLPNPKIPHQCPACGAKVVRPKGAMKYTCTNTLDCLPQVLGKLDYFTGRDCANITHLGTVVNQLLITECGVKHPADLFKLTKETLSAKLHFTVDKIDKIYNAIQSVQTLPLEKILAGLGVHGLAEATAKQLVEAGMAYVLPALSVTELVNIPGVDEKTAHAIFQHFQLPINAYNYQDLLRRLAPKVPKVYNKRHYDVPKDAVYIGRPTKWGNPYSHLEGQSLAEYKVATREEAVERFEQYLLSHPELLEAAKKELRGKDVVCWCAPKSCHGHILVKYANQ